MEVCSIPSMFYITGVKAYSRLSISQIGIQSRQYAKVRITGPYLVYYAFSSTKQANMIFLGSLHGVQVPYCWNLVEKQSF